MNLPKSGRFSKRTLHGNLLPQDFETVSDARPTEENATRLRGYSYENASKATGKMPALPAFSCFVVALSAMKVGITPLPQDRILTRTAAAPCPDC